MQRKTNPKSIELLAINDYRQICYHPNCYGSRPRLLDLGENLVLAGTSNHQESIALLTKWVRERAKILLPQWLERLSHKVGVSYQNVTIRGQKTCWGSCTSQKNISLNYKLLFVPSHLVEHVLLHELCHLRHLNHSPKFWDLLSSVDPLTPEHRRAVRKMTELVPSWLE